MTAISTWWRTRTPRERATLSAGLLSLLAILFVSLVWLPLRDDLQRTHQQVIRQAEDLGWLQQQVVRVSQLSAGSSTNGANTTRLPLLTLVDKTATGLAIRDNIRQIQPGREAGTARIWFDKVMFEDWLRWLDQVVAQDVKVVSVSITRSTKAPTLNIRVELAKAN
mgnify:FL=1